MSKNIWLWLKSEHWDKVFFYAFLLSFPFGWRKVVTYYPPLYGMGFGEYWDIALYVPDFFLLIAFVITIQRHTISYMSKSDYVKMFHVEHFGLFNSIFLIFIAYAASSSLWSPIPEIALFSSFQMIRVIMIIITAILIFVPRGTFLNQKKDDQKKYEYAVSINSIIKIILVVVVFQVAISLVQLYYQQSIGLKWLGESQISLHMLNVAKIESPFGLFMRPYGTFPHPNVLGGFMGGVLMAALLFRQYSQMFHVEHSRENKEKSALNKEILKIDLFKNNENTGNFFEWIKGKFAYYRYCRMFHVEHIYLNCIILLSTIGLMLSFSKSAILATILSIAFIRYLSIKKHLKMFHVEHLGENNSNFPLNTAHLKTMKSLFSQIRRVYSLVRFRRIKYTKMFHVEHWIMIILVLSLLSTTYLQHGKTIETSIKDREDQVRYILSANASPANYIFGIGFGQSVILAAKEGGADFWELQPVHNTYLLIFYELGVVGFILAFLIILFLINVPRGTLWNPENSLVAYILIIGLFDHYLITLYQGNMILALVFICVIVYKLTRKKKIVK